MSLRIAPRIQEALAKGLPLVALESTLITHGLPQPRNLETAAELEETVREAGAVPATVAILAGELVVGASSEELERLAHGEPQKASLWNLAALLAQGANAGTTVATTLYTAAAAGITVFATGGIGGVHPQPFDESADLMALSRYPVLTVCAGPKSILLTGATLERLETLGVPVVGYRSQRLAGFHVRETEHALPASFDDARGIAEAFQLHRQLGLSGGMLVSNPVSEGLGQDELDSYRAAAQSEAQEAQISGRELTPFLLARLAELSSARTVDVNLRLLRENVALAARVAQEIARPIPRGAHHE
ncbi:MAG: pseudouridine-5'-phosphate glycosidase [Trueperaceae bacterium]